MTGSKTGEPPRDHHFVPVFYLKNWIMAPEARLVEYARRDHGQITGRWSGPKGTGYEPELYDAKDGKAPSLETTLFRQIDTDAADAMKNFGNSNQQQEWEVKTRTAWSRFLMSMMMRHPEDLVTFRRMVSDDWTNLNDEMREVYLRDRTPDQPETAEEYWEQNREGFKEIATLRLLRNMIDHKNIGGTINNMAWNTAIMEPSKRRLLTSDRPVLMTDTLAELDAFIMMPLSPTRLLIAVRRDETMRTLEQMTVDELVDEINLEVVQRAEEFVFASDMSETDFIREHFGKGKVRTLFHDLEVFRAADRAGLIPPRKKPKP